MTTENIDDRISRMEGALPYLATKADVESLRADMIAGDAALQSEIGSLRTELKTEIGSLRTELRTEIGSLRAELKTEIGSLRADMIAGDAALQSEIGSLRAELRTEIGSLRADIYRDIYRMEARLIKWWVGSMIAMTVVISSLLTIFRFLGS